MIYAEKSEDTLNVPVTTNQKKQNQFSLNDKEIQLSQWCYKIEKHYKKPMDIGMGKDGRQRSILFRHVLETVHGKDKTSVRFINLKKRVFLSHRNRIRR
jgi:pyruvate,water dikinase